MEKNNFVIKCVIDGRKYTLNAEDIDIDICQLDNSALKTFFRIRCESQVDGFLNTEVLRVRDHGEHGESETLIGGVNTLKELPEEEETVWDKKYE